MSAYMGYFHGFTTLGTYFPLTRENMICVTDKIITYINYKLYLVRRIIRRSKFERFFKDDPLESMTDTAASRPVIQAFNLNPNL